MVDVLEEARGLPRDWDNDRAVEVMRLLVLELEAARRVVEAARKPAVRAGHLLLAAAIGHYDALKAYDAAKAGKAVE